MPAALLLLLQAAALLVGDSVVHVRRVALPAGARPEPLRWVASGAVQPLGEPRLRRAGPTLEVRYAFTLWRPGTHAVALPPPVLVRADGRRDTLPVETVSVTVASALPRGVPRDSVPPAALLPPLPVTDPTPLPLALLLGAWALALGGALRWRRRRGPPVPEAPAWVRAEHGATGGDPASFAPPGER